MFEGQSVIDKVFTFDKRGSEKGIGGLLRVAKMLRNQHFDCVYSLHRSGRTSLLLWLTRIPERIGFATSRLAWMYTKRMPRPSKEHEVLRNLALLGEVAEEDANRGLSLEISSSAFIGSECQEFLAQAKPYVVLFPSSSWFTKQWNGRGYTEVAQYFSDRGMRVVILGSGKEREYNQSLMTDVLSVNNLTGTTSLTETALLVSRAALVVCNDSLALHLACAFLRPTVVVFCATSPTFGFGPWRNPYAEVVEMKELPCKPCRRHGSVSCPTGTNLCMTGVKSNVVIRTAEVLMAKYHSEKFSTIT